MVTKRKAALAGALALVLVFGTAAVLRAAGKKDSGDETIDVEMMGGPTDADVVQMSHEGFVAATNIQAARDDINDGNYAAAMDRLRASRAALKLVQKEDVPVTVTSTVDVGKKESSETETFRTDLVPISAHFVVGETVSATPEKAKHIAKARQHMAKGNTKAAMAEYKLADVSVSLERVAMPLAKTQEQVATALDQLKARKYHDANLTLKAAEDGLVYSVITAIEPLPAPSKQAKRSPNG